MGRRYTKYQAINRAGAYNKIWDSKKPGTPALTQTCHTDLTIVTPNLGLSRWNSR